MKRPIVRAASLAAVLLYAAVLPVGRGEEANPIVLPSAAEAWLNSTPLTKESLQGKCVAFWFYEEQCPKCRAKWPEMLQLAKSFEGKPVLFVAVNSGNAAAAVGQYMKAVGVTWPTIVDSNRQFEAQWRSLWGGSEISLSNVHQIAFLTRDGRALEGQREDIPGSVKRALEGRAVPKAVPGPFVATWQQIHAGNYVEALPALKKGLGSRDTELKAVAQYAQDIVEARIRDAAKDAEKA